MVTEILIQVLLALSIIAVILLIAVLWKSYGIVDDLEGATKIIKRRVGELDSMIANVEKTVKEGVEAVKGFASSMSLIKSIKEKIETYKKGDKDGE